MSFGCCWSIVGVVFLAPCPRQTPRLLLSSALWCWLRQVQGLAAASRLSVIPEETGASSVPNAADAAQAAGPAGRLLSYAQAVAKVCPFGLHSCEMYDLQGKSTCRM